MKFDLFFSICQAEVDGVKPSERIMFENFFDQVVLADQLGFGCAWVAESHLSSEIQKKNQGAVIPEFKGEIGLNTDILQLAHRVFARTKRIHVGSAIRNILANGGPMAHAEAVRMFLSLHGLDPQETRRLELGFASGRFPYSNLPYGICPRNELERQVWPILKGLIFQEATEIFLRFLRGDVFSSNEVRPKILRRELFRTDQDWQAAQGAYQRMLDSEGKLELHADNPPHVPRAGDTHLSHPPETPEAIETIKVESFWKFDTVGVIPFEAPMHLLRLTIGAHDFATQKLANEFLPVGVFNLSITSSAVIEETNSKMIGAYHAGGGPWTRALMPRTVLVFIDEESARARVQAEKALGLYWRAMEGTLDPVKVAQAIDNALVGTPQEIAASIRERYHPEDRLMLWFDFNNHDNFQVKRAMTMFMEEVAPNFAEARASST